MALHKISKGLDLPISGGPLQIIHPAAPPTEVAVMGDDYHGMKPRMAVAEGDTVRRGDLLFEDRKTPGVRYTAPASGEVRAVNRGAKRVLQSVVIRLNPREAQGNPGDEDFAPFEAFDNEDPRELKASEIRALLVEAGLWTAFRSRPFSHVPAPDATPDGIFVTAMDTNPLAADPAQVLGEYMDDFNVGLQVVSKLTEGRTYLCVGEEFPLGEVDAPVEVEVFVGPHPAGNAGVHINRLLPVGRKRTVWTIGYQDVVAVAKLCRTGRLWVDRVAALGGPGVKNPRLLRTRLGASLDDITAEELAPGDMRVISGSVLAGKKAMGPVFGFLGRYDTQISVLPEGREREFLGWLGPGLKTFSVLPVFVSKVLDLVGLRDYAFSTSTNGSTRAMVPIGVFEKVNPTDIQPTFLLRALAVGDLETAERLGALELDEEDVALYSFVDPGKGSYGPLLRENLETIYKEG